MKTKLTLTVRKRIIESAKQAAKQKIISLSQLFEEIFVSKELEITATEIQKSTANLLSRLAESEPVKSGKNDKALLRDFLAKKYA